jgi:hypothetical protein
LLLNLQIEYVSLTELLLGGCGGSYGGCGG